MKRERETFDLPCHRLRPHPKAPEHRRTPKRKRLPRLAFVRKTCYFAGAGAGAGAAGMTASVHLSVRNGDAGRPAPFDRLGSAVSCQPKRTATGLSTPAAVTMTLSPEISALASTNF